MPYSKKVIEAFKEPHNYGKIKNPDGRGKVGNAVCGDILWLYIKVDKSKDIIKEIRYQTFGCIAALASSSIITDLVKGKRIGQALKLTKDEILEKLGGLPPIKVHCSVLAIDALDEAIYDYLLKNKKSIPEDLRKRHKVLGKERKMIEEKYKDWIKREEELHQEAEDE
jgi:nitrogen fixation NifU-like protein